MPVLRRPRNRSRLLCRAPVLHVPHRCGKLLVHLLRSSKPYRPQARYHRCTLCHRLRHLRTNLLLRTMRQDINKIRIIRYEFNIDGYITAYTDNGSFTLAPCNVKPRRGKYKLFCDRMGQFYTLSEYGLRQVIPINSCSEEYKKKGSSWKYMKLSNFVGSPYCHYLICNAFHGPRPDGYECDHINGIHTDNRACNLQWVTPAENIRRAILLRELRKRGLHPEHYDTLRILHYFQTGVWKM